MVTHQKLHPLGGASTTTAGVTWTLRLTPKKALRSIGRYVIPHLHGSGSHFLPARQAIVGRESGKISFYHQVRGSARLGHFSSEEVGKKVRNYDPIPGKFVGCVPLGEIGNA